MDQKVVAGQVIEALRRGVPPQRGVDLYSVGNEKLIEGIQKYHLASVEDRGLIRFVNGSWGAGKTHFFRLLREIALQNGCLVSNVELNVNDAALNKFERVFYAIVRNVETPTCYEQGTSSDAVPFSSVVQEALAYLGAGTRQIGVQVTFEDYQRAHEALMADHAIDIDFKKLVGHYWQTYLPEAPEPSVQEQARAEILQWFAGEGTLGTYRKRFGVNKMVTKDNAKLMLRSLAGFVRLSGYKGLVILFDEAEQAYSIMRKSALRDAHNNLLSLINNVEGLSGLLLIYATTPDFFSDPKHGIVIYGALAGRIGKPPDRQPRALDTIWNLDALEPSEDDYRQAALRIRDVYASAYPEFKSVHPTDDQVTEFVDGLTAQHPALSQVRFWRVLVSSLTAHFDDLLYGEERSVDVVYHDVMDELAED